MAGGALAALREIMGEACSLFGSSLFSFEPFVLVRS
jgi:hypothetical protein